jgi:flagella basal body P-ring formation protein FlgA
LDDAQAEDVKNQLCGVLSDYLKLKSGKPAIGKIDCDVPDRQLSQLASATSKVVCTGGSDPWTGRQKFTLAFSTAAGKVQVPVYADVAEAATPIVVALRSVAKGNVITAADVEVRTLEPSAKNAGQRTTFDSIENLIGKEARQALQQDEIVYSDQIQSPLLVKRGDVISVASQSGGIRVRTTAKAAQDGAQGDLIQVEAMGSKQRYDARVVGLREASVFAPAHLTAPQKTVSSQTAQRQLPDVK